MNIQVVELSGERYVILPEKEFLQIQAKAAPEKGAGSNGARSSPRYRKVIPLRVEGIPVSQLLIQDRE